MSLGVGMSALRRKRRRRRRRSWRSNPCPRRPHPPPRRRVFLPAHKPTLLPENEAGGLDPNRNSSTEAMAVPGPEPVVAPRYRRADWARPAGGGASLWGRDRTVRSTAGDHMALPQRHLRTRFVLLPRSAQREDANPALRLQEKACRPRRPAGLPASPGRPRRLRPARTMPHLLLVDDDDLFMNCSVST